MSNIGTGCGKTLKWVFKGNNTIAPNGGRKKSSAERAKINARRKQNHR